jgi:hypothetical protein
VDIALLAPGSRRAGISGVEAPGAVEVGAGAIESRPRSPSQQLTSWVGESRLASCLTPAVLTSATVPSRSTTRSRSEFAGSEVVKIGCLKEPICRRVAAPAKPQHTLTVRAIRAAMQLMRRNNDLLVDEASISTRRCPLSNPRMANLGRIGKVEVGTAARADLDI